MSRPAPGLQPRAGGHERAALRQQGRSPVAGAATSPALHFRLRTSGGSAVGSTSRAVLIGGALAVAAVLTLPAVELAGCTVFARGAVPSPHCGQVPVCAHDARHSLSICIAHFVTCVWTTMILARSASMPVSRCLILRAITQLSLSAQVPSPQVGRRRSRSHNRHTSRSHRTCRAAWGKPAVTGAAGTFMPSHVPSPQWRTDRGPERSWCKSRRPAHRKCRRRTHWRPPHRPCPPYHRWCRRPACAATAVRRHPSRRPVAVPPYRRCCCHHLLRTPPPRDRARSHTVR
jgi:hypothetical protein